MDLLLRIYHAITQLHPPHTLLVHFPIALITTALFFLLVALWMKNNILEQVAFADMSLAVVSIFVCGIVGIRDNIVFYAGGAPNHIAKIVLASILFVVTGITVFARWRNKEILYTKSTKAYYISAYIVSFIIVTVLGFLGGIIIFGFPKS